MTPPLYVGGPQSEHFKHPPRGRFSTWVTLKRRKILPPGYRGFPPGEVDFSKKNIPSRREHCSTTVHSALVNTKREISSITATEYLRYNVGKETVKVLFLLRVPTIRNAIGQRQEMETMKMETSGTKYLGGPKNGKLFGELTRTKIQKNRWAVS